MTGWESPSHWVIIALVVLVLFGYKKLPEMSRSVGRSLRIFKTEMKGMGKDDEARESAETGTAPPAGSTAPATGQAVVAEPPPVTPAPVYPVTPAQQLPPVVEEPHPAPQQRT
ncbi:Sec-independent protein translocase subunit TatA [Jatrophihabitans sp.]|uniref:Sec-independent protein translocase subunit TatA n=1 Tax=Jatrophihabitans sp. TaxID=1932789 RepID=UPI002C62AD38|nr:Sec-independent protein translocase subunit TatA [Jatrophihabitans sp.]